jgi:hypothetical protein
VKELNAKQFLIVGGIILIILGILGFIGVIGPSASQSIFGSHWWFDAGENWAHLVLGIIGVLAAFALPAQAQRYLVMLLGILGILVGLYSIFVGPSFLGANLENPLDSILHLVVGAWALWASSKKNNMVAM